MTPTEALTHLGMLPQVREQCPEALEVLENAVARLAEIAALVEPLRGLERCATPGPWVWSDVGEKSNSWVIGTACDDDDEPLSGHIERDEGTPVDYVCEAGDSGNLQDPALIAAARNALPALLRLTEKL